jgi:PAS domain S-box-containing protein
MAAMVLSCAVLAGYGAWTLAWSLARDIGQTMVSSHARMAAARLGQVLTDIDQVYEPVAESGGPVRNMRVMGILVSAGNAGAASRSGGRLIDDGRVFERVLAAPLGGQGVVWRVTLDDLTRMLAAGGADVGFQVIAQGSGNMTQQVPGSTWQASSVRLVLPGSSDALIIAAVADPAAVRMAAEDARTLAVAAGFVAGLLALALVVVVSRRLTVRLTRLADAAESFAQGGADRSVFRDGASDEVSRIGAAFADTVERLDRAYHELDRKGRTMLSNTERVAQIGSASWDPVGEAQEWSDQFYAVLGLDPLDDQACREAFFARVHPDDRDGLESALSDGQGRVVEDFRLILPDGGERVAQLRAEVARDADGKPTRIDVTIQDISERKRLEERLDGLVRDLKRSNEELEQFAYVASHDLRQPLRTVRSYISLIEESLDDKLDGETREFMDFIRDGVKRMDSLITDLLAYSRVGRLGKDGAVDTGRALDLALLDLQSQVDEAGATIYLPDWLPVVIGETGEMTRLFQNLIGNAVKYRDPKRKPEVEVTVGDLGGEWVFAVKDNGIGIPEEHAERIFGIFQRLHARHEYEGTGIGLAICRKIVERHGGVIWARGIPGHGSMFQFTWPKMRRLDLGGDSAAYQEDAQP